MNFVRRLTQRDGETKPIKVLITATWLFLFLVWGLFIAAIVLHLWYGKDHLSLIDIMFKGIAGLLAQLMVTLTADIVSKKLPDKNGAPLEKGEI